MIDVKNLEKTFGDHKVLAGINEHIYPGERSLSSDRPVPENQRFCAV